MEAPAFLDHHKAPLLVNVAPDGPSSLNLRIEEGRDNQPRAFAAPTRAARIRTMVARTMRHVVDIAERGGADS